MTSTSVDAAVKLLQNFSVEDLEKVWTTVSLWNRIVLQRYLQNTVLHSGIIAFKTLN